MTFTQRALLRLHEGGWNGLSAGEVGATLWPDHPCRPGQGVSSNGGGHYAAQMLLGRLKNAGLVEYARSEGATRWRLSRKGRDEVSQLREVANKEPKTGAAVTDIEPCTCGHAPEQHGRDPEYPGSTSCTECECIAYEADLDAAGASA